MRPRTSFSFTAVLTAASLLHLHIGPARAITVTSYANDFVDPKYVLAKDFTNFTIEAQDTIVAWAEELAAQGPWCG